MTITLIAIGAAAAFIIFLLAIAMATRQEPKQIELLAQAPSHLAGAARRMLGVSVRRPEEWT